MSEESVLADDVGRSEPLPPRGEGVGDGGASSALGTDRQAPRDTPTPNPSPQGGGELLDHLAAFNEATTIEIVRRERRAGPIQTSQRADGAAKRFRKAPTLPEQRLWKALRELDLNGSHFRRQAPFGPYVVDFVCHRARLIVEVDGGIHNLPSVAERDSEREAWLRGRGYDVVRVSNEDALYESASVVGRIVRLLSANEASPSE
jgi:very-short-patch-repair endonuclease